jgi:hypothetical protein
VLSMTIVAAVLVTGNIVNIVSAQPNAFPLAPPEVHYKVNIAPASPHVATSTAASPHVATSTAASPHIVSSAVHGTKCKSHEKGTTSLHDLGGDSRLLKKDICQAHAHMTAHK